MIPQRFAFDTPRESKLGYVPGLDGIRAIAVLSVVAHHARVPGTSGGFVGVDIFFVLSGFLITRLLWAELKETSRIDLGSFYRRRFCRLTPPLILLVLTFWLLGGNFSAGLYALFYLTDWMPLDLGNPLNHTWSLAIEEQFYLLWPIALLALSRLPARRLVAALVGLYIVGTLWRMVLGHLIGAGYAYFRFDAHSSGLLLGSLLAIVLVEQPRMLEGVPAGRWAVPVGLSLLALFPFLRWAAPLEQSIAVAMAELLAALAILSIVRGEPNFRWLSGAALVGIGRISYGIYLFHYPICFFLIPPWPWLIRLTVILAASLLLAALSYHLVERPIMRTFGARRDRVGEAAAPVERAVRTTANVWPGAPDEAPTPVLAAAGPERR